MQSVFDNYTWRAMLLDSCNTNLVIAELRPPFEPQHVLVAVLGKMLLNKITKSPPRNQNH